MRKLVLVLITIIAVVTFVRSFGGTAQADEVSSTVSSAGTISRE